ncbi:hypothetical protein LG52_871 [Geobacillus kaustophilus]|uniref:Uncharacterized protein n=1 Tax=Geobacillus kaustophilus TaxID=1462 RepID=A0A0D8BW51_GEOKU|nr:hypothetical protein LG52_871 [Geobacillus kaustophilus]
MVYPSLPSDPGSKIVRVTDVAYSRAEALVRTEANFFHNLAAHNSYRDAGMEKYEILTTLGIKSSLSSEIMI